MLNQRRQGGFTRTSSTVEHTMGLPSKQYSRPWCINMLKIAGNLLHDGVSKLLSPGHMGNPQGVPQSMISRDLPVYAGEFSGLGLVGGIFTTICSLLDGLPFCVKFFIRSYLSAIQSSVSSFQIWQVVKYLFLKTLPTKPIKFTGCFSFLCQWPVHTVSIQMYNPLIDCIKVPACNFPVFPFLI